MSDIDRMNRWQYHLGGHCSDQIDNFLSVWLGSAIKPAMSKSIMDKVGPAVLKPRLMMCSSRQGF
jgi:hypothetical protein